MRDFKADFLDYQVAVAEFGEPLGPPVFHFHGHGNSRFEGELFIDAIEETGVRFIVIDRPGYGGSMYFQRSLLQWPEIVNAVAEKLGISRFAVMGISGGGPHALSCAFTIPDKITRCAVISTPCPPGSVGKLAFSQRMVMMIARRWSWLYSLMLKKQSSIQMDPMRMKKMALRNRKRLPKADYELLQDDQFLTKYARIVSEGYRQGVDGPVADARVFCQPWGFDPTQIKLGSQLIFWHGEDDLGYDRVRQLSRRLNCTTHFITGEGHVSIAMNNMVEILDELTQIVEI